MRRSLLCATPVLRVTTQSEAKSESPWRGGSGAGCWLCPRFNGARTRFSSHCPTLQAKSCNSRSPLHDHVSTCQLVHVSSHKQLQPPHTSDNSSQYPCPQPYAVYLRGAWNHLELGGIHCNSLSLALRKATTTTHHHVRSSRARSDSCSADQLLVVLRQPCSRTTRRRHHAHHHHGCYIILLAIAASFDCPPVGW